MKYDNLRIEDVFGARAARLSMVLLLACGTGCPGDDVPAVTTDDESSTGDDTTTTGVTPTPDPSTTTVSSMTGSSDDTSADDTTADDTTADDTSGAECGNGVIEDGEDCDGDDLGGEDCASQGFDFGELACGDDCTYDDSMCGLMTCGNDAVEGVEVCDGADLAGEDCVSQGADGGTLACDKNCMGFDLSGCFTCGDDMIGGMEVCDGADLSGEDCVSQGFDGGTLACAVDCSGYDLSGCSTCGDGMVSGMELCDGGDLGGDDCVAQGFMGGILTCNDTCDGVDTGLCTDIPAFCSAPALPIGPDIADPPAVDTINIPAQMAFATDVNVLVDADHTWTGDLDIAIRHVPTGTTVTVYDQACGNDDDIAASFDQDAAMPPDCMEPVAIEGAVLPAPGNLDTYVGLPTDMAGDWELTITDNADGDEGTLHQWCVTLASGAMNPEACGDGVVSFSEGCDDGGNVAGDGCSDTCQIENGFECVGQPSVCSSICGDGLVALDEACDDGDVIAGDGCDDQCNFEVDFSCVGEPSVCMASTCGPHMLRLVELSIGTDYVDLQNTGTCVVNLGGLNIFFDDSSFTDLDFALPGQDIMPGQILRVHEGGGGDIDTMSNIFFSSARGGAAILCTGVCTGASEVIDVVAFSEGEPHAPLPPGVTFAPAGLTGIVDQFTEVYARIAFAGVSGIFLAADWQIQ